MHKLDHVVFGSRTLEEGTIFVENILSDQSLKAVAEGCRSRGWDVQVGASLYTDALGEEGSGAEVYIGMMKHNVRSITQGLSPE